MRKNLKRKSKSLCAMCKDYKVGWASRWEPRQEDALRRFEKAVIQHRFGDIY